ncbi:MAG: hypothetical protein ACRDQ9_16640, partial [Pseudonocardiaceae bacterium]
DAGNPACAAYAAATTSQVAFLRGDTPTALDTAAAARSLAARTDDARLKAHAELRAASAYALDGQHGPYMAACARSHQFLANATARTPDSLAYYVHEGTVDAASNARARYARTPYVYDSAQCDLRLGNALVLSHDITEAARVLGDAASLAHLSPRLTAELHTARALMQPWASTQAVTTLDAQLHACGLMPTTPGPAVI